MTWPFIVYTVAVLVSSLGGLVLFAYLDRIYRELGRVTTGRIHANLDVFEAEIEPRFNMERRRGALTFGLLANGWLVLVAVQTARGVTFFTPGTVESLVQHIIFLAAQIAVCMHFLPYVLIARTAGRWLKPFVPVVRLFCWMVWPVAAVLEVAISLTHFNEEKQPEEQKQQEGLEALVEAAEEQGILEREEAKLIEQVVEFGDKRVRDVMTPRPEIVAIPADATIEQLRRVMMETKYSRLPVYEGNLDEVTGLVYARDLLQVSESDARTRRVEDLARPVLFVPETKFGSQLLTELQQKRQQMAVVIDEYGSTAGVVTVEDLVEEIVGEIHEEDRSPVPLVVREPDGSLLLRGSVPLEKVKELLGIEFESVETDGAATIGGLLNVIAGHVPVANEVVEFAGHGFEVLEANQRKVLRVRVRRRFAASAPASARA
jgi:CBS domain containing-hemolysin-like protein